MTKASVRYDRAWQYQVKQCRAFIKKLENTPTMHGQKWKDSMLRHYRGKLEELLAQRRKPL
jgi:hypothetical protein